MESVKLYDDKPIGSFLRAVIQKGTTKDEIRYFYKKFMVSFLPNKIIIYSDKEIHEYDNIKNF